MRQEITITANESGRLWTDAMLVARGVADVLSPTKMNYEVHGNTIPLPIPPRDSALPSTAPPPCHNEWSHPGYRVLMVARR
jgi:hypothetical protein